MVSLQEAAELLGKMGAPARDQAAATAQAAVHSDLAAAHCDRLGIPDRMFM